MFVLCWNRIFFSLLLLVVVVCLGANVSPSDNRGWFMFIHIAHGIHSISRLLRSEFNCHTILATKLAERYIYTCYACRS